MIVGMTGAEGLIDWHLRCYLRTVPDIQVKVAGREAFQDPEAMTAFVRDCDGIVHLAGVNRGEDQELYRTNMLLTRTLLKACESSGSHPHLVFSSSIHADRDTAYGRSKRQCSALMAEWACQHDSRFTELVLPHVFGEGGRPFYNSVVSTFCHQLAHGDTCQVNGQTQVELVHAQIVCREILKVLVDRITGSYRLQGSPISVGDLHDTLVHMASEYSAQIIPDVTDPFRLALFNTYRSYLFPQSYPVHLTRHVDDRGSLVETVKSRQGGQTFISDTLPGITRGNHFHAWKVERFLVLAGEAEVCLRKLESGQIHTFQVSGDDPAYIDIPTLHAHSITNIGSEPLVTLFWSSAIYDPKDPDTYKELVREA